MSTTNDFGYDYVFELAKQLSPEEVKSLMLALESYDSENSNPENQKNLLHNLDQEKIEEMREKARRLALECPVATEEEIELQNEFRRMFRCRPS